MKKETYLKIKRQKSTIKLFAILTILSMHITKAKSDELEKVKQERTISATTHTTQKNNSNNLQYESLTSSSLETQNASIKYYIPREKNINNLKPKNNSDIAHRGYTPGRIYDNSAEGFRLAGDKGFWGCEADVRFDGNGNLVCSHGTVKKGQNPTTFEEFLDICKEYGMTAIIDLKYQNGVNKHDANLSPSILKTIEEKGMIDSCVLQTNNPIDISYIRSLSSEARIWYLTDVISDSNIQLIYDNQVECVNIQSSENDSNRIKKLVEYGIDVCVWNVQTKSTKDRLLDRGATYIMSDNVLGITPYNGNILTAWCKEPFDISMYQNKKVR